MTLTPTMKVIAGAIVVIFGGVILSEYTSHVKADAQAAATIKAQETYQKTLQDQLATLRQQMADRDAKYNQDTAALQKRFQQAASPQQIATLISNLMGLKQPITITTPPPTPSNPNPQPVAQVPLADAPQAKQYVEMCESCKLQLAKAQDDLSNRQAQAELAQQQIASLKVQRDSAVTAAKGGNVWHRTTKALKYLGIGAVAGAAAVCGSGHCK